jgi:hypothetical protein
LLLAAFYPQAMSSLAEEFPDMPAGVEYKPSSSDVMCTTLANGMKVRIICLFLYRRISSAGSSAWSLVSTNAFFADAQVLFLEELLANSVVVGYIYIRNLHD